METDRKIKEIELKTQKKVCIPTISGKRTAFLTNDAGSTVGQHAEKCKLTHSYLLCTKLKSKWIKHLHKKQRHTEAYKRERGEETRTYGHREHFLEQTTNVLCSKNKNVTS